jgi:hypothetical protein
MPSFGVSIGSGFDMRLDGAEFAHVTGPSRSFTQFVLCPNDSSYSIRSSATIFALRRTDVVEFWMSAVPITVAILSKGSSANEAVTTQK